MTATQSEREALIRQLVDLEEEAVLAAVGRRLARGDDPLDIIEDCNAGMRLVGERYEQGQYFVSALIMSGEIFREAVELVHPALTRRAARQASGRVLVGTVSGDIHDIGKNMAAMLLECYGFTVVDLGVDVPPAEFAARAVALRPDVVGLSGLISASFEAMRETTALLRVEAARHGLAFPIVVGGSQIDEEVFRHIGADYWVTNAMDGVRLCQRLLGKPSPGDP